MTYGGIIKECRASRCMTLQQVAEKVNSHKGYISGIENGKVKPPSSGMTKKLASLFELDKEELLEIAWAEKAPKEIRARVMERMQDNRLLRAVVTPKVPSRLEVPQL